MRGAAHSYRSVARTALAVATVVTTVIGLAACGGVRVDGTTWRADAVATFSMDIRRVELSPEDDQLVTDCRACDLQKVEELDYLIAGADDEGRTWQAWLRFDLADLGSVADVGRATLVLPPTNGPSLPSGQGTGRFEVRPVADAWSGDALAHGRTPRLSSRAIATFERTEGRSADVERIDVTSAVQIAVQSGRADLTLAIVAEDAADAFRWRIASVESGDPSDEASTPRLIVEFGPPPPPAPAAVR